MTAYVVYVAALNVLLSTSLFDSIVNRDPETIDIHYRRGWTFVPGRIHAEDLSIRSSDSNVEWILRLDEVAFDVSFLALAHQRFDVTRARGHGISMRVRQKLSVPPQSVDDIANLPPIPGYPAYSMRPAGPPSLERWFDEHYALWTVSLSDVIADDVREVWVDSGRFEGSARITGGFYLRPIRDVVVGPIHLEARPGSRVTLGEATTLAPALAGTIDLAIERFDPRGLRGNDVFRFVTLTASVGARFADPSTLPLTLPFYASGEIDVPRVRLVIDRGILREGTRVEMTAARMSIAKANVIGHSAMAAVFDLGRDERGPILRGKADLEGLTVVSADASELLRAKRLSLSTNARALDLATRPLSDTRLELDLPDAEMRDASVLDEYLRDASFRVAAGRLRARAHAEISAEDERASGRLDLEASNADVRSAKRRVRGAFATRATFGTYRFGEDAAEDVHITIDASHAEIDERGRERASVKKLHVDGASKRLVLTSPLRALDVAFSTPTLDVETSDLRISTRAKGRAHVRDWTADHVALDGAVLTLEKATLARSGEPKAFASIERLQATLRSRRLSTTKPLDHVDVEIAVAGGTVVDPTRLDAFLPKESGIGMAAEGGSFDAQARLTIDGHIARGHLSASAKEMGIRSKRLFLYGNTDVDIDVRRLSLETKTLDLGPSHFVVDGARGRIEGPVPSNLTAERIELRGQARDLDFDDPSLDGVDARLVLSDLVLPDARALQFLVPAKEGLRIASGSARAFGDVTVTSSAASAGGILEVDILGGALGIHETELQGDFAFRALFRGFDPKTSTIDFAGSSLTMRDVRVTGAAAEARHWRGEAVLEKATLRLDGPEYETPCLDGVLRLDADNARPLLGVLLGDSLPKLVVGLVTMPRLTGYARVHVSPNLVLADSVSASGGDVAIRGTYGLYGTERRGAFIVEKGPLSVGIGLDKDGASPHFFNLDAWLGAHRHDARAKAAEELRHGEPKRDALPRGEGRGDKVR